MQYLVGRVIDKDTQANDTILLQPLSKITKILFITLKLAYVGDEVGNALLVDDPRLCKNSEIALSTMRDFLYERDKEKAK